VLLPNCGSHSVVPSYSVDNEKETGRERQGEREKTSGRERKGDIKRHRET
jgi:hypothetical protein